MAVHNYTITNSDARTGVSDSIAASEPVPGSWEIAQQRSSSGAQRSYSNIGAISEAEFLPSRRRAIETAAAIPATGAAERSAEAAEAAGVGGWFAAGLPPERAAEWGVFEQMGEWRTTDFESGVDDNFLFTFVKGFVLPTEISGVAVSRGHG